MEIHITEEGNAIYPTNSCKSDELLHSIEEIGDALDSFLSKKIKLTSSVGIMLDDAMYLIKNAKTNSSNIRKFLKSKKVEKLFKITSISIKIA